MTEAEIKQERDRKLDFVVEHLYAQLRADEERARDEEANNEAIALFLEERGESVEGLDEPSLMTQFNQWLDAKLLEHADAPQEREASLPASAVEQPLPPIDFQIHFKRGKDRRIILPRGNTRR